MDNLFHLRYQVDKRLHKNAEKVEESEGYMKKETSKLYGKSTRSSSTVAALKVINLCVTSSRKRLQDCSIYD